MPPRFRSLQFMRALKAARDLGLSEHDAADVAVRFDPRAPSSEHLVDALADRLLERGVLTVPEAA